MLYIQCLKYIMYCQVFWISFLYNNIVYFPSWYKPNVYSFYGTKIEMVDHIFWECSSSQGIWDRNMRTLHIRSGPMSTKEVWSTWRKIRVSLEKRKAWDMIRLAGCWAIWGRITLGSSTRHNFRRQCCSGSLGKCETRSVVWLSAGTTFSAGDWRI